MKYMLMICDNADLREALFAERGDQLGQKIDALMQELIKSGKLAGGTHALTDPSSTKSVRTTGGVPVITDGPFAEAKEYFSGYLAVGLE